MSILNTTHSLTAHMEPFNVAAGTQETDAALQVTPAGPRAMTSRQGAGWMHAVHAKHDTLTQENVYFYCSKQEVDIFSLWTSSPGVWVDSCSALQTLPLTLLISLMAAIELCTDLSRTPSELQFWPQFRIPQV